MDTNVFAAVQAVKAERLAQGLPIVDLSVGSPDIAPAPHIIAVIAEAAARAENYVYALRDQDELLQAAAFWYQRRYQVDLDPQREVCSLLGSQDGLAHLAWTLVDPGDTVLVPDPCYPIFAAGPALAGAQVSYMPLLPENDFLIDLEAIPPETARAARLMVVSYPNNPTAALAPPSFYQRLIDFAQRYDIIVLHDNAYSDLVFDGAAAGSFLNYPGAKEVGVEFNSLSKSYGLAGARIGFCLGNAAIVAKLRQLKTNLDYGMFLPVQQGAIAALTGDQTCVESACRAYQRRRDLLCQGLAALGWSVPPSPATMFLWAPLPQPYTDSQQFCADLAKKSGVLLTPGSGFGPSGQGHVRMALVQPEDQLQLALDAIAASGIIAPQS